MKNRQNSADKLNIPSVLEFADLTRITGFQRIVTLAAPFVCVALYFVSAVFGWWILAVPSLMFLSFITYGSTSHDLVHGNLGLTRSTNNFFLFAIELLADGYHLRAPVLAKAKRYNEAINDYTKLISLDPSDAAAYRNRAAAREQSGESAAAAADRRIAAALDKLGSQQ